MNPIVMRSLGGMAPARPRAEAGIRAGRAEAAARAAEVWRRKSRRVTAGAEVHNKVLCNYATWRVSGQKTIVEGVVTPVSLRPSCYGLATNRVILGWQTGGRRR